MKRIIFTLALTIGLTSALSAQEQKTVETLRGYTNKQDTIGWNLSGVTSVTVGQTSLTNWAAGGDNTISGDFLLNASANYLGEKWFWDNNLVLQYGQVFSSSTVPEWRKSSDKISLASVAGYSISSKWSASFLLNFQTQFAHGYKYPDVSQYISTFMAPGYLDGALGFSYKPNSQYSLFLSPIAERAIFVLDDALSDEGKFGVDPGEKLKWSTGAYVVATMNQSLWGNLSIRSRLDLYTPYNENFGNVDVNWDLMLNYKLSRVLSATLNTTLRYYDKEIQKIQFREVFGLGLTWNF